MLSNLVRLPYRMLLESGDCTNARFSPDFAKEFPGGSSLFIDEDASEEKLHPINRFFALLDPEMWEITSQTAGSGRPVHFPLKFLNRLLRYLTPSDLKTSRLISKTWNNSITGSRQWKSQFVGVIDTSIPHSWMLRLHLSTIGLQVSTFLETSKYRFRLWNILRLRHLQPLCLWPLLTSKASSFGRSVKHVRILSLSKCHLFWLDFLELLYHFRSLQKLEIIQCIFTTQGGLTKSLLISLGGEELNQFPEIVQQISSKCPTSDYFFGDLKNLRIIEADSPPEMMTPMLLTLLKPRTGEMDEFYLELGRSTAYLKDSSMQDYLWQSVHSFLSQKNVRECSILSNHAVCTGLVNRFFAYMSVWKTPPSPASKEWRLTNLNIEFRPLVLWYSFERHLIPLVNRLHCLKTLCIKSIVLRGNKVHLVKELMEQCHPGTKLEIGVILDDKGDSSKGLLATPPYQKHLGGIELILQTDSVREIRDLIPFGRFLQVRELIVSTNGKCRPSFFSFNFNLIVHNFPGLRRLEILDGPTFQYGSMFQRMESQWDEMSGALVADEDIQILMKSLKNLEKFVIRANLKYTTDTAFTGLSGNYCRKVGNRITEEEEQRKMSALELIHREGVSFSNLPRLNYVCIEGIGPGVTDVSTYLAFKDVTSLKYLGLFGSHQISTHGKEFLESILPRDCKIYIS